MIIPEGMRRNLPTDAGRALGAELARLIEPAIARLAAAGEPDTRCSSCAFRLGTLPNGCEGTTMDAVKAVVEGGIFYCHAKLPVPREPCHGWYAARVALNGAEGKAPWPYSTA